MVKIKRIRNRLLNLLIFIILLSNFNFALHSCDEEKIDDEVSSCRPSSCVSRLEEMRKDFQNNLLGKNGVKVNKERALEIYEAATGLDSESVFIITMRGLLHSVGAPGYDIDHVEAARLYRIGVAQGYAPAQYDLAYSYSKGEGVEQDDTEALRLFHLAAAQGYPPAQRSIGLAYYIGESVEQDYAESVYWFRLAAEQSHALAQQNLGYSYYRGEGVEQDYVQSAYWFHLAAEQRDCGASNKLGCMYENGEGVEENDEEAVRLYQLAAEQDSNDAQCNLGRMYLNGKGTEQDYTEALRLYHLAAENGDTYACYCIGYMYGMGFGVAKNATMEMEWYRKAAEKNNLQAQHAIGIMYKKGQGVEQDYEEAVRWFLKAVDQGNADAIFSLALCYNNGNGVEQDYEEALRLYRLAAEQGNSQAKNNIGFMYAKSEWVKKDYQKSMKWLEEAAEEGEHKAQGFLGYLMLRMENQEGVDYDCFGAEYWLSRAAMKDNIHAIKLLGICTKSVFREGMLHLMKAADLGDSDSKTKLHAIEEKIRENKLKRLSKSSVQVLSETVIADVEADISQEAVDHSSEVLSPRALDIVSVEVNKNIDDEENENQELAGISEELSSKNLVAACDSVIDSNSLRRRRVNLDAMSAEESDDECISDAENHCHTEEHNDIYRQTKRFFLFVGRLYNTTKNFFSRRSDDDYIILQTSDNKVKDD